MKNSQEEAAKTVLLVVSVSVRSQRQQSGDADIYAFQFLQRNGFVGLAVAKMRTLAQAPDSTRGEFLLLECNRSASQQTEFKLIHVQGSGRQSIESGRTIYIASAPNAVGSLEVIALGEQIHDWEFNCRVFDPATAAVVEAAAKTAAASLPPLTPTPPPDLEAESEDIPQGDERFSPFPPPLPSLAPAKKSRPKNQPKKKKLEDTARDCAPNGAENGTNGTGNVNANGNGDGNGLHVAVAEPEVIYAYPIEGPRAIVVPVDEVIPFQPDLNSPKFSGQPRTWFDPEKLRKLGEIRNCRRRKTLARGSIGRYYDHSRCSRFGAQQKDTAFEISCSQL